MKLTKTLFFLSTRHAPFVLVHEKIKGVTNVHLLHYFCVSFRGVELSKIEEISTDIGLKGKSRESYDSPEYPF